MIATETYSQNGQDRYVADVVFKGSEMASLSKQGPAMAWISNTLLLEVRYGWTGILVEPTSAYEQLLKNRPNCRCENSCLASTARDVTVVEIFDRGQALISPTAQNNLLLSRTVDAAVPSVTQMNSRWGETKTQ